jgi:molybdate transport system substrate-binding protein
MKPGFEEKTGITLHITYSASGALARQIEQGAPIDVFVSAGKYVDELLADGLLRQDSIVPVGFGLLVPIQPVRSDGSIVTFKGAQRIAIANPETAPYGAVAKAQLEAAGLWDEVAPRIVYAESALQAFQFAKAGEVDYAFVPLPLLRTSPADVALVDSAALGLKATSVDYSAAITTSTADIEHAHSFADYLTGPNVQLTDFGYDTTLGLGSGGGNGSSDAHD